MASARPPVSWNNGKDYKTQVHRVWQKISVVPSQLCLNFPKREYRGRPRRTSKAPGRNKILKRCGLKKKKRNRAANGNRNENSSRLVSDCNKSAEGIYRKMYMGHLKRERTKMQRGLKKSRHGWLDKKSSSVMNQESALAKMMMLERWFGAV